jgi:anion-transporting  ArsA/GET3 family ATPase
VIERLRDRRVVICAGSGGVGKTTTAAALAMGLAAAGRRVAVVTIDPARRLADSLGLEELDNEPRLVDPRRFEGHGIVMEGELWAMMLDPKRTFDELVAALAPDAGTRDDVLRNRIYQQLSAAVAGSQEFTAVAKLYELHRSGRFDVLVLDTPPSRNALDFLDAPDRITGFLEGNTLKVFLAKPSGLAGRLLGTGTSVVLSVLRRLTGVDLLEDLGAFFRSLGSLIDGFRERAEAVKALLADPSTTFLIVSSPEREPVEEAIFFRGKLADHGMPFGGLVVNRAHVLEAVAGDDGADDGAGLEALEAAVGPRLAKKVRRAWTDERALAARDAAAIERLRAETGDEAPAVVPQLGGDVHDIDGLVAVHAHLFGSGHAAPARA